MTASPVVLCRYGGDSQPRLDSFADLKHATALPPASWAVTSCPSRDLHIDKDFLKVFDKDGDGWIRVDEVLAAVGWLDEMVTDSSGIDTGKATIRPEQLAAEKHKDVAERLAEVVGHRELTRADLQERPLLGIVGVAADGAVPLSDLDADDQERAKQVVGVSQTVAGSITIADLDAWLAAREARLAWLDSEAERRPWGDASPAIAGALIALDPAVRSWFLLTALDEPSRQSVDVPAKIAHGADPEQVATALRERPLAALGGARLRYADLRPPWRDDAVVAAPIWPLDGVDAQGWSDLIGLARMVQAAEDAGAASPVRGVARDQLEANDAASLTVIRAHCQRDAEAAGDGKLLAELDKLLLLQRYLLRFCRNLVSLHDLYDPTSRAIMECGDIVLAGWSFHLVVAVHNRKVHAKQVIESGICVVYLKIEGGPVPEVAVPVTRGDPDAFWVGRRGLFVGRDGKQFGAVVTQVVDNPVSVGQAVLAPFLKIGTILTRKLEGFVKQLDDGIDKTATKLAKEANKTQAAGPGLLGGTVAFAAAGSAFAFVTKELSQLGAPTILLAMVLLAVLIVLPTGILASIRLYRRDLAALLAAGGWAVNDRMRLTAGLARLFTRRPKLPEGTRSEWQDQTLSLLGKVDQEGLWQMRVAKICRWGTAVAIAVLVLAHGIQAGWPTVALVLGFIGCGVQLATLVPLLLLGRQERWLAWTAIVGSVPVIALFLVLIEPGAVSAVVDQAIGGSSPEPAGG